MGRRNASFTNKLGREKSDDRWGKEGSRGFLGPERNTEMNGTLKAGMRTGVMVIYKNGSVKEYGSYDNVIRGEDGTNNVYVTGMER